MKNLKLSLVLATASMLTPLGCGSPAAPPVKPVASVAATPAAPTEINSQAPPDVKPIDQPKPPEAAPPPEKPAPPPESRERLLVLTPGGPLVFELTLTIDGRPFDASLSKLAAEALAAADTDGDGKATWKEVLASPKFKFGQYGNNPITPEMTLKSLSEMYDSNRDGLLNASEAPKFLTKNTAGPHAFSLRATNQNRGDNVLESPLRRWLDEDEDGQLSAAEVAAAPIRLLSADADDDELLVPADFLAPAAIAAGEMQAPRGGRRFGPDLAFLLNAKSKWNSVLVALEELYGVDGTNRTDPFPHVPELFAKLDADHNGALDKQEVTALLDVPPHVSLAVEFGAGAPPQPPLAHLRLKSLATELTENVKVILESESRLALSLPGSRLEIYCRDAAPSVDYEAQAQVLLTMYDADKNGYVEEKELPAENAGLMASFEALDADGDGKIFAADIYAQLARQQAAVLSQIQARAGDQEDALFAALDRDADGRLSAREISASAARLASLDANQDGALAVDEVPGSLALGVIRGETRTANEALAAPAPPPRVPDAKTPLWFLRMDLNQDGELSPREFLGSLEKFQSLDEDRDGFLSLEEIAQSLPAAKSAD